MTRLRRKNLLTGFCIESRRQYLNAVKTVVRNWIDDRKPLIQYVRSYAGGPLIGVVIMWRSEGLWYVSGSVTSHGDRFDKDIGFLYAITRGPVYVNEIGGFNFDRLPLRCRETAVNLVTRVLRCGS